MKRIYRYADNFLRALGIAGAFSIPIFIVLIILELK